VPQRRRRIALVADFGGGSAPEILFEREGLCGDFAESGTEGQGSAADAEGCAGAAICIQENVVDRDANCNGKGWRDDDVSFALNTIDRAAVCIGNGQSDQLRASAVVGALNCMHDQQNVCVSESGRDTAIDKAICLRSKDGDHGAAVINQRTRIRRLTPLECERLQGYPDGWTDIGEWVDSKGKRHQTTDSARYKALGNSIALPYWRYLLKRISAQFEYTPTMASLFDGIGGFPYLWEGINGKGTCLWASEIEEFPMAVTKLRIGE
jgi:DNA (cytosine-5)-methyltransferase 1